MQTGNHLLIVTPLFFTSCNQPGIKMESTSEWCNDEK